MNLLNLGCGNRFYSEWTNVDFTATDSNVIAHNLIHNVPFLNASFDVIYHSHVLEHFSRSQASTFLAECYRVLRPNGIIRISVPDLEQVIRGYIFFLEQAVSGSVEATNNYNWLLLELFDQMVRNYSGGEMANYLFQENLPGKEFIIKRLGTEAKNLIETGCSQRQFSTVSWLRSAFNSVGKFICRSSYRQNIFLKVILSTEDYQALKIGRFRQSGENHQWMYDSYSLTRLLEQCGFTSIVQRTASDSYVANWSSFNLDTEADGTVYKPDSLYMEAIKAS